MTRSKSAQHRKVEEAKRVVQRALGEAARRGSPQVEKYVPMTKLPEPAQVRDESIGEVTIGEVAARLDISRAEVERVIATGKIGALWRGSRGWCRRAKSRGSSQRGSEPTVPLSRRGGDPGGSHGIVKGLYQPICGTGTMNAQDAPVNSM
jgi:hypothetical protein